MRFRDQQLRRDADKVGDDLTRDFARVGTEAGGQYGDNFARASSPKIERASKQAQAAQETLILKQAKTLELVKKEVALNKRLAGLESDLQKSRAAATRDLERESALEAKIANTAAASASASRRRLENTQAEVKAVRALGDAQSVLGSLSLPGGDGGGGGVATVGRTFGQLAKSGPGAAIGIFAVGKALSEVSGWAVAAAQSLWALPAVITAAGAGIGTIALATSGFSDAISATDPDQLAEAMANLAPSAQSAATSLRSLIDGPLADLRLSTQEAFFSGVGDELTSLSTTFTPIVQEMTAGIATAMNDGFMGLSATLQAPDNVSAISGIADNIAIAFQNATPALESFGQIWIDITSVGADFLPGLADDAAELAAEFQEWIESARESGQLEEWLQGGINALKDIASITGSLGSIFLEFAGDGESSLHVIATEAAEVAEVFGEVAAVVKSVFNAVGAITSLMNGDFKGAYDAFNDQFNTGADPLGLGSDPNYGGGGGKWGNPTAVPDVDKPGSTGGLGTGALGAAGTMGGARAGVYADTGWGPGRFDRYLDSGKDSGGSGGSGSSGSSGKDSEGRTPNLANLEAAVERIFGVQANADANRVDKYGEHGSGTALDIMVGSNTALGNQINQWLLQNADSFGLQYNLWQRKNWKPNGSVSGMEDRGDPTQNHMDHLHARVSGGAAADNSPMMPGDSSYRWDGKGAKDVNVQSISDNAANSLSGPIGAAIDSDFGASKGLPGIFENLFKVVANLAMAPVLGALTGVTTAFGSHGPGSGLLGMLAGDPGNGLLSQRGGTSGGSGYGGSGFAPTSGGGAQTYLPGGSPFAGTPGGGYGAPAVGGPSTVGLGSFTPPGAPAPGMPGSPGPGNFGAPGTAGLGIAAGQSAVQGAPGYQPASYTPAGSGIGETGTYSTEMRGRVMGEGVKASEGIGIGGGIIGAAQSAGAGAANMFAPGAGAGAQIAMDLINRAIGFGGQAVGIGIGGLMETFLPVESELADPMRGWFGKGIGALAGVRPAADLTAGKQTDEMKAKDHEIDGSKPLSAEQVAAQKAKDGSMINMQKGGDVNVEYNNNGATEDRAGADLTHHLTNMNTMPGGL